MNFRNLNEFLKNLIRKRISEIENRLTVHGPKSAHDLIAPAWPSGQRARPAHARGAAGARPWRSHHAPGRCGGAVAGGAMLVGASFGLRDGNPHGEGVAPGNRRGGGAHRGGAAPARRRRQLRQRRSSVKGGGRWPVTKAMVPYNTGERRGG
jgi:hypothetical protein